MVELRRRALVLTCATACLAPSCAVDRLEPPAAAVSTQAPSSDVWAARRAGMVESQLRARDIRDERVLAAMARVPRHLFVPESERDAAYADHPLPIGHGQTISQPYIVAYMSEALRIRPSDRVLEIGTGSGYQAAILAELAGKVFTMEIVEPLADRARATLADLGYRTVEVRTGNGYLGWPERAPFDRIMVTAAPEQVPPALEAQLAEGGIMVIPVGAPTQVLTVIRRTADGLVTERTLPVLFVPMVGKPGG
jgi:protein-L-isoaspartate(D-aspartate) O-methyltransferase